ISPSSTLADPEGNVALANQFLDMMHRMHHGPLEISNAEMYVATSHEIANHSDEALDHYARGIAIRDKLGVRDAQLPNALTRSGWLKLEGGHAGDALTLARRAIDIARPTSEDDLASALGLLGRALITTKDLAAARAPLREALSLADKLHLDARRRARTRI